MADAKQDTSLLRILAIIIMFNLIFSFFTIILILRTDLTLYGCDNLNCKLRMIFIDGVSV